MAGAKYKQIAEDLRERITTGTLSPGSQLPTEPQLAAAYGASRSTVRLAIGLVSTSPCWISRPMASRTVLREAP